MLLSDK